MTKTTNYEISKKLAEIGFNQQTDFYWYCYDDGKGVRHIADADGKGNFKSYDLEILLNALPEKTEIIINQLTNKREFYLDYGLRGSEISVQIKENESLADTAGKMIILLHEKNLIKF
jgi:hypothetical protein